LRIMSSGISTTANLSFGDGGNIYGDNNDTTYSSGLYLIGGSSANNGAQINLLGIDNASAPGDIQFYANSNLATGVQYAFYRRSTAGVNTALVTIEADGTLNATYLNGNGSGLTNIGAAALAANSVDTSELVADSVTSAKILNESIISADIQNESILSADILNGGINGADIATNAITGSEIADDAVGATELNSAANFTMNSLTTTTWVNAGSYMVAQLTSSRADNTMCWASSNGRFYQTANAAGCTNTSDARLKKDVETLAPSLEKLLALRPVSYHWKDEAKGAELQMGFIAQEVHKVLPNITVAPDKEHEYWGMYNNALIPYLVKGVQELKALVDHNASALRTENAALAARVEGLEAANKDLARQMEALRKDVKAALTAPTK